MSFIAGPYTVKSTPQAGEEATLGVTETGFIHNEQNLGEEIRTDPHGGTIVDGIHTGKLVEVEFVELEYSEDALVAGIPQGDGEGEIGSLWSEHAPEIVATPIRGAGYEQFTYHLAYCRENIQQILSGTQLRKLPMRFLVLPDDSQEDPDERFYIRETVV